jgi:uncharacterized protein YhhL (DUF1145 family)
MTPFFKICRAIVVPGWLGLFAGAVLAPPPFSWACAGIIAALVAVHVAQSMTVAKIAAAAGVPAGPEVLQTMVFGFFHLEPFRRAHTASV